MSASKKSKQANVTAEELKQQMFQAMQSTGVLHKVKVSKYRQMQSKAVIYVAFHQFAV